MSILCGLGSVPPVIPAEGLVSTSQPTGNVEEPLFWFLDVSSGSLPINWPQKKQNDTKTRVPIHLTAKAREVARIKTQLLVNQ